jgi:hypothetical protein
MDENFRYKTNNFSLHFVLRQIESGRMEVDPAFKDLKSWTSKEKSQFVESIILGIPTQPIWCEETASGDYIVIEGSERLKALVDFVKGQYALIGVKIRKEYTGCHFDSLPYHEQLALEDRYTFPFIVINYDTSPQLKCEFFRRLLNDTGNSSNQSARNFAWPQSFKLLQLIKSRCEHLIDFAPRDARWRLQQLKTTKGSSSIDEVFLYLLMILTILRGEVYEDAYLDPTISIDDLLDWTMRYFDDAAQRYHDEAEIIFWSLSLIRDHLEHPPKVILSNSIRVHYKNGDALALPEFYLFFIRTLASKLNKPINWAEARPQRLVNSSSARNFISQIFQSRND